MSMRRMKEQLRYLRKHPAFQSAPLSTLWRLLLWWFHCRLALPAIVYLPSLDIRLFLPSEWRGIAKLIYVFRDRYENELLFVKKALTEGCVFLDVGAAFGIYTLTAAKCVGSLGHVLAFEPTQSTCHILRRNLKLSQQPNIVSFQVALADVEGTGRVYHNADSSRNSMAPSDTSFEEVRTMRLDEAVQAQGLSRVDLIKIDVEGAEQLVLQGAKKCLTEHRPKIIFEINPTMAQLLGLSPNGAWNVLEWLDYRFFTATVTGDLTPLKTCPAGGNVIALPKGKV